MKVNLVYFMLTLFSPRSWNFVCLLSYFRQEWDMYAVPFGTPGGSTVPFGWVAPAEPSSDIWASALKD